MNVSTSPAPHENRIDESSRGVFIISATPFHENGSLDLESADSLVDFYIGKGVSGITVLGMMGEAPKLTSEESRTFVGRVLQRAAGRIPVVVGVSDQGVDKLVSLSHDAMEMGAAGVMIAPQPTIRTDEQLLNYFGHVFERLGPDVPVCYQDYPLTTKVEISVPTFEQLVASYPQLVMLKHEDCPGLRKLTRIRGGFPPAANTEPGGRRVSILCGNGGLYLPLELTRGADGAMTGFAYPEMLVEVVKRHSQGDMDGAEDIFDAYLPLVRFEQQPGFGLALRKEVLRRRGAIRCSATRAMGPSLDASDLEQLERLIARVDARLAEIR